MARNKGGKDPYAVLMFVTLCRNMKCHISSAISPLLSPFLETIVGSLISTCALQNRLSHHHQYIPACCLQKILGSQIPKMLIYPAPRFMSREEEAWRKLLMKRNTGNYMYFMCTGKTWAHLYIVLRVQPKLVEHLTLNQRFQLRILTKTSTSLRFFCFQALPKWETESNKES